jgi:hypothetical protein
MSPSGGNATQTLEGLDLEHRLRDPAPSGSRSEWPARPTSSRWRPEEWRPAASSPAQRLAVARSLVTSPSETAMTLRLGYGSNVRPSCTHSSMCLPEGAMPRSSASSIVTHRTSAVSSSPASDALDDARLEQGRDPRHLVAVRVRHTEVRIASENAHDAERLDLDRRFFACLSPCRFRGCLPRIDGAGWKRPAALDMSHEQDPPVQVSDQDGNGRPEEQVVTDLLA